MYKIILLLYFVFTVALSFSRNKINRRYNVDQEAIKHYGEDSATILKRFRRSPEYLKILQDKKLELKTTAGELSMQILFYYHKKIEERVCEILPSKSAGDQNDETKKMKVFFRSAKRRQDEEEEEDEVKTNASAEKSKKNIHDLDNYRVFSSELSVAERNSLRDLGFEMAGNVIHSIIENMGCSSEGGKYTLLPGGGDYEAKTEEHTTVHPVTHEGPGESELRTLKPNRVADVMLLIKKKELKSRSSNKDPEYLSDSFSDHADSPLKI